MLCSNLINEHEIFVEVIYFYASSENFYVIVKFAQPHFIGAVNKCKCCTFKYTQLR